MKKLLALLIVSTTILSGCRYKEGPMISFRTVYTRLIGVWQVTEYTSNGVDSLQYYNDSCGANLYISNFQDYNNRLNMLFYQHSKKDFHSIIIISDNRKELYVSSFIDNNNNYFNGPFSPNTESNWNILKLTNKELKVTVDINNKNYRMSLKKISDLNGKPI